MSWVATAVIGSAVVGAGASMYAGGQSADAAMEAADTQVEAQMAELQYLKEINELPQAIKEDALTELDQTFNPATGQYEFPQERLIDQARESPLYGSIMGAQASGEEAIMRHASATGGLRSGDTQHALYDYNVQLQNEALLQSYNDQLEQYQYGITGLKGLAEIPTNEAQIGATISGIGGTRAAGITAAAQAEQAGITGAADAIGTGLSQFLGQGII